jgi:hypothetical protein
MMNVPVAILGIPRGCGLGFDPVRTPMPVRTHQARDYPAIPNQEQVTSRCRMTHSLKNS